VNSAEIEVLVQAGMSHEFASLVVASYTMASTLAGLRQQATEQSTTAPEPPAPVGEDES
jgi:hypothetical protein